MGEQDSFDVSSQSEEKLLIYSADLCDIVKGADIDSNETA